MAIRSFFRSRILSTSVHDFIRRILVALLIATIFLAGLQLRRWIGDTTRHVRYQHDIVNGFYWGSEVLKQARRVSSDESSANSWTGFYRGYFALYDRVKDKAYKNDYGLDYPPLRLLAMAIWAKQVRNGFPGVDDGHPKLVNPLLKINLLCEMLSAIAIFLLVRLCVRQSSWATRSWLLNILPQQHRASICGLAAASYGTEHYPYLFISSCYNLPSLLSKVDWSLKDSFLSAHFGSLHLQITLQWTLRLLYLGALALCARGLARHLRDRDPRVLIAIAAPWLLMFALLGQMHERYLMWGAVVSAVALGVSVRLSIIHFIISIASTAMIVHVMLIDKKLEATLPAINTLKHIRPYGSVVLLGCVAVYLWETTSTRIPVFQHREVRAGATPSLALAPEPEEA